jgi:ribosomal protein S18 acetylase RimI-like enzyme
MDFFFHINYIEHMIIIQQLFKKGKRRGTMDSIQIRKIKPTDLKQARKFAAEGMNLSWYVSNQLELYFYSRYVLYHELSKSTIALGAYSGDRLVGFIFARFKNEPVIFKSFWHKVFEDMVAIGIKLAGYTKSSNTYDIANKEMFDNFLPQKPDGEITFFAVDPTLKGKKIGSRLLEKLESEKKGKLIYLYTDTGSTYQFYLHRGFEVFEERELLIPAKKSNVKLTCFLMSKKI